MVVLDETIWPPWEPMRDPDGLRQPTVTAAIRKQNHNKKQRGLLLVCRGRWPAKKTNKQKALETEESGDELVKRTQDVRRKTDDEILITCPAPRSYAVPRVGCRRMMHDA